MSAADLIFNGVNGITGGYLTPPLPARAVARLALGQPVSQDLLETLKKREQAGEPSFGFVPGVNASDLATAGWGVIFPVSYQPAVKEALTELLEHRRKQAGRARAHFYQEFIHNHSRRRSPQLGCGFQPGDSPRKFLARNGAMPNFAANPENVPYYLLIVAGPDTIPYEFQYELDIQYAVGRIWFEKDSKPDLEAFAHYASSVVTCETESLFQPRRAVFFGTQHDLDRATGLSATKLVQPLRRKLAGDQELAWDCQEVVAANATKARLTQLVGGTETPAFLFTATHGMGFPTSSSRQLAHQGALVCQDFPGPLVWGQEVKTDHYFAAEDVGDDARLLGLIAFHFACYGAGTPMVDDFDHVPGLASLSCATPWPTVARLPQRLLGHAKGGALAVVGHVDRAWSCSFYGGTRLDSQIDTYHGVLKPLLQGLPIGFALECFNQYHASVGNELGEILKKVQQFRNFTPDPEDLSQLWTTDNDARNFVLLGDPAVRLTPAGAGVAQTAERPIIRVASRPAGTAAAAAERVPAPEVATAEVVPAASFTAVSTPITGRVGAEDGLRLEQLLRAASSNVVAPGMRIHFRIQVAPPGA
jgi:hypothetical protein